MYIIEISLKFTPMPVSVQRKTQEDALSVYQQVLSAMQTGSPAILELTCEQQEEKCIACLSGEIAAVQMYEKSGGTAGSKRPGFAAFLE
jgi:hypothetical protein